MLKTMRRALVVICLGMASGGCVSPAERQNLQKDGFGETVQFLSDDGQKAPSSYRLGENPGLSNYIAAAAAGNPGLKAAFLRWKAATEKAAQERWLEDPALTYEYFFQQVSTRQQIGLTQSIPGFGKRSLRAQRAGQEADVAWQELRLVARALVRDVKEAFYDFYYLGRSLAVTEENVKLLESLEEATLMRYETGGAEFADVIRVQAERDKMKNELAALRDQRSIASARLAAQLGLSPDTVIPMPAAIPETPAPPADGWPEDLTRNNPELESLATLAAAEATAAAMARRAFLPDFIVGANFMLMPGPDGGNETDQSVMAGITLPLWFGKYRAGVREAEARRRAYLLERDDKANKLAVDLKVAAYAFRDAERRKALYRDSLIPKAEQALNVARQEFSNGKEGFSAVIEAQRNLLEFRLQWERAGVDREKSLADVDRVAGKDADVLPTGK